MTYARAAYSALPQKFSRITFQPTYANLSSKITQHVKFTKAANLTKIFSSEKFIDTNNIFTIKGKKPFLFHLRAWKQGTQSVTQNIRNYINF